MIRWTRVALFAAVLVLVPAAAQSFFVPTATAAYGDDAYRDPGGGVDGGPAPAADSADRADSGGAWLAGEWGIEPAPGSGPGDRVGEPGGSGAELCRPGTPPNAPATTQVYNADPLLGPALLPTAPPVGPLLAGYQRFDGLTQAQFIQDFTNFNHTAYVYPPFDGFALDGQGQPIKTRQELLPGYRLDRFGNPGGRYLSPLGTPFSSRALPPANLITPENAPLANYHVYCVLKPFFVDSGPIAPWFAQPGWGTQYKLNAAYLPEAGTALTVTWLVQNGFLVEENLTADEGGCHGDAVPRQRAADRVRC